MSIAEAAPMIQDEDLAVGLAIDDEEEMLMLDREPTAAKLEEALPG